MSGWDGPSSCRASAPMATSARARRRRFPCTPIGSASWSPSTWTGPTRPTTSSRSSRRWPPVGRRGRRVSSWPDRSARSGCACSGWVRRRPTGCTMHGRRRCGGAPAISGSPSCRACSRPCSTRWPRWRRRIRRCRSPSITAASPTWPATRGGRRCCGWPASRAWGSRCRATCWRQANATTATRRSWSTDSSRPSAPIGCAGAPTIPRTRRSTTPASSPSPVTPPAISTPPSPRRSSGPNAQRLWFGV